MRKRRWLVAAALLLVLAVVSGCGTQPAKKPETGAKAPAEQPKAEQPKAVKKLNFGTMPVGGGLYNFGVAWATLINKYEGDKIQATVVATGGTVENIPRLIKKELEVAWPATAVIRMAQLGQAEGLKYISKEDTGKIRALFSYDYGGLSIVVREDSGIKQIADIKGKKFSLGDPGSTAAFNAKKILEVHGLKDGDYKAEYLDQNQAVEALKDGLLDGFAIMAPIGNAPLVDLATNRPMRLLSVKQDLIPKLKEALPGYEPAVYKIGDLKKAYSKIANTEDVTVMGVRVMPSAHVDLDEDSVYYAVKALFEHLPEFYLGYPQASMLTLEHALGGSPCSPLHVGALKYFQEKGCKIPEAMIPPEAKK